MRVCFLHVMTSYFMSSNVIINCFISTQRYAVFLKLLKLCLRSKILNLTPFSVPEHTEDYISQCAFRFIDQIFSITG